MFSLNQNCLREPVLLEPDRNRQNRPVRSAKKFQKTGFFVQIEYGTGQNRPKPAEPTGLDWGLSKLKFFFKTRKFNF